MKRKEFLLGSISAGAGFCSLAFVPKIQYENDAELISQVKLLRGLDNDSFSWIWGILKGITKEELDWKINKEANSIRWILGHLIWFEEWACDAIEATFYVLSGRHPGRNENKVNHRP